MTHYPSRSKIYHIKSDSLDTSKLNKDNRIKPPIPSIPITHHNHKMQMPEKPNPLSGLLGQYDSDSDHETTVNGQLDAKVDNFLQEINQIAPEQQKQTHDKSAQKQTACPWQECFDESTGYPYYWNMETNAVTWEMPPEYKLTVPQTNKPTETVAPTPELSPKRVISVNVQDRTRLNRAQTRNVKKRKAVRKDEAGSSDDEKIVMITSFSEGSSSESENERNENENENEIEENARKIAGNKIVMGPYVEDIPKQHQEQETKKEIIENIKDENIDETVILARLRTQAKVLHELGGELPKSVDKILLTEKLENKPQSLCLVAGYGDDSDHSDPEEEVDVFKKTIFPIPEIKETTSETKIKESTLFPVTAPIDIKQFESVDNVKQTVETKDTNEELIDNKAFKRKKRLGLTFDVKKSKIVAENEELLLGESRKGFGFQTSDANSVNVKKSGIAFIKADVLNSNDSNSATTVNSNSNININNCEMKIDADDFTEIKNIVTEKVNFLGEGKDPVSAVQIMSIQLQTLEAAYNVQALTKTYLYSWLRETFTGLEKLEQEAAPEGWTCQWDRSHKRYFYRNTATGETQWHYPATSDSDADADATPNADADIVGGGEAMDICTTPPPNEDIQQPDVPLRKRIVTPSPPRIQNSPSPPPPPSITPPTTTTTSSTNSDGRPPAPPLPQELVPPPPPTISENQPLPPGVDSSDLPYFAAKLKEKEGKTSETGRDSLGSELDSFYSDIAQLEAGNQGSVPENVEIKSVSSPSSSIGENPIVEGVKKKKKSKPKMGQGINMKKKAVSSLVEKWKKVQNDY